MEGDEKKPPAGADTLWGLFTPSTDASVEDEDLVGDEDDDFGDDEDKHVAPEWRMPDSSDVLYVATLAKFHWHDWQATMSREEVSPSGTIADKSLLEAYPTWWAGAFADFSSHCIVHSTGIRLAVGTGRCGFLHRHQVCRLAILALIPVVL